jgi:hypothetical protein
VVVLDIEADQCALAFLERLALAFIAAIDRAVI